MTASPNDLALIAVMRRYFVVKDEVNALKRRLEAVRNDSGEEISRFYDPRANAPHAEDILAWHQLRKEMEELMSLASTWGRGGSIEGRYAGIEPARDADPSLDARVLMG
ncbi:hypothetical protein PYH37_001601 [Sinorhizobium numidicum]|uniref:Uncharacterized protein n=1 Tax=Sinorhizobium numidicum TaxID=680248 RepID=A0ABY8CNF0_9HYPH|nr:hypothetical protein [Sinorhizobium numidicum]WEX74210.1 hypothetical protein PYH37_001601 [Sinorhizobium numidicum]WEX80195.1 hypothetical protein PYH38_001602 [Sinorhizobium numidicum]